MPARNPFTVVEALRQVMSVPGAKDQRVTQVISNALTLYNKNFQGDIFYIEDDVLIDCLRRYTNDLR
jgi:hypothetical protein